MAWFDLSDGIAQADKDEARLRLREDLRFLHEAGHEVGVRISAAAPEADLYAAVWPGLTSVTVSRAESVEAVRLAEETVARLEQQRGMRPGTVALELAIETPRGVHDAPELAAASTRITGIGIGDARRLALHLGVTSPDSAALQYARGEVRLAAMSAGVASLEEDLGEIGEPLTEPETEEPLRI